MRVDYTSTKNQSGLLIDKESESGILINEESRKTTHRKRIRRVYSSTKNQIKVLIEKESKWSTLEHRIIVDYS